MRLARIPILRTSSASNALAVADGLPAFATYRRDRRRDAVAKAVGFGILKG